MSIFLAESECVILFRYQNFIPTRAQMINLKGKMNVFHVLVYMWSSSTTVYVTTENSKPPSSDCCLVDRIKVPQLQLQVLDAVGHLSRHSVTSATLEMNFYPTLGQFHLLYHYVKWKWEPKKAPYITLAWWDNGTVKALFLLSFLHIFCWA